MQGVITYAACAATSLSKARMPASALNREPAPLIWTNALMFALTFAVAAVAGALVRAHARLLGGGLGAASCSSWSPTAWPITAGYHRLWAHRTYEAHWSAAAASTWCSAPWRCRTAPSSGAAAIAGITCNVDDVDLDPYSARRGFWFSHIGWMLREYPSGKPDFSNIPDLQARPDAGVPAPLLRAAGAGHQLRPAARSPGWLFGDVWGMLLLAGVLRLVWSHHFTFFINSLAHMWGSRPYTEDNTARDNRCSRCSPYGEGYHNFHHIFAHDYRNGVRWWQWDPTKWLIAACSPSG